MTKKKSAKTTGKFQKTAEKISEKTHEADENLVAELEAARQNAKENHEKFLRAAAEIENLKKRHAKDLENAHNFALEKFAKALLEVKDSLTLGLSSAHQEAAEAAQIIEGLEMTNKIFTEVLERFGVEMIHPEGEIFDANFHEICLVRPADVPPNTVVEVMRSGFTLNGRLLRPAQVVVSQ